MRKRAKFNGLFLFFILIAIFFLRPSILFANIFINHLFEIFGLILSFFGQIIRISARGYKAESSGQSSLLLTDGPYAVSRNPMYFGTFLIGFGVCLIYGNIWLFLLFLLLFTLRYYFIISSEEKKLHPIFEKDYEVYLHRVPIFLPSFRTIRKFGIKNSFPFKKKWIKRELNTFLFWLLVVLFVLIAASFS